MPPQPSLWRKHSIETAFTKTDEAAISRALKEQFPGMVIIDGQYMHSPEVHYCESIDACEQTACTVYLPGPGWEPKLESFSRARLWAIANSPNKEFQYHRSWWDFTMPRGAKWAWDPPTLTMGVINNSYLKWDEDARKFKLALWRLLNKFGTYKFSASYPHLNYQMHDGGAAQATIFGHDALRWCSKEPTRMIAGGFRPHSSWEFPDLKWYEGLEPSEPPEPPEWWKKQREEELKARQAPA